MKISKHALRDARRLFRGCLVGGLLEESRVRRAAELLVEKKPRDYVQVLKRLHRLVRLDVARHTARVESAAPLSAELRADVAARVKKKYGEGVSLSFGEDPALLGGLRIQVGSDLYDGSIRARLEKLEHSF